KTHTGDVEFYKMINGEYEQIVGNNKKDVDKVIKYNLCDVDIMENIYFMRQEEYTNFLFYQPTDRYNLIVKMFKLDVFASILNEINKIIKKLESTQSDAISTLKSKNFDEEIKNENKI